MASWMEGLLRGMEPRLRAACTFRQKYGHIRNDQKTPNTQILNTKPTIINTKCTFRSHARGFKNAHNKPERKINSEDAVAAEAFGQTFIQFYPFASIRLEHISYSSILPILIHVHLVCGLCAAPSFALYLLFLPPPLQTNVGFFLPFCTFFLDCLLPHIADILEDIGMTIRSEGHPIDHITKESFRTAVIQLLFPKLCVFVPFWTSCSVIRAVPTKIFVRPVTKMFHWPSGENQVSEVWLSAPFLRPSIWDPITFKHDGWKEKKFGKINLRKYFMLKTQDPKSVVYKLKSKEWKYL